MAADRRVLAGALGLALIVAACGSSSASVAPTSAATEPAASVAVSEAPAESTEAQASDDTGGPEASFTAGGAAALEAMLPDSAGGQTFTKTSFDGASIAGAAGLGFDAGELDPILKANGKSIQDVKMAIAAPANAGSTTTPTVIIALQVNGLDASKLAELAGVQAGAGQMTDATISGKPVKKFGAGAFSGAAYVKDDVLFEILFADDAALADILSKLP
jgi:hypothetical protein